MRRKCRAFAVCAFFATFGLASCTSGAERAAPGRTVTAQPSPTSSGSLTLRATTWRLSRLVGPAVGTRPDRAATLIVDRRGAASIGCNASRVTVRGSTIVFHQAWLEDLMTTCPELGPQQSRFLYEELLTGTVHWRIDGNRLTISKPGHGAALFVH
jgi:heat shock protein HslJ